MKTLALLVSPALVLVLLFSAILTHAKAVNSGEGEEEDILDEAESQQSYGYGYGTKVENEHSRATGRKLNYR